jgi:hypothetical protein
LSRNVAGAAKVVIEAIKTFDYLSLFILFSKKNKHPIQQFPIRTTSPLFP